MRQDESPQERTCPVCGTKLPDAPSVRRCPNCGAKALQWKQRPQPDAGTVLFNARIAGIMAGGFLAMTGLLVLGYRFPLPWYVALTALALPIAGYAALGAVAERIPRSWRTHYLVGVLAADAGLLTATVLAVMGFVAALPLLGIAAGVAVVMWPFIRRAVAGSIRDDDI